MHHLCRKKLALADTAADADGANKGGMQWRDEERMASSAKRRGEWLERLE